MADEVVGSGEDEGLRECYHAFLARRMARGDRSIRTRRGFGHLRASYQPHVRFLLEQADFGGGDDEASTGSLKELVEPYIDTRVLQFITDVCWPLAHFGPQDSAVRKQVGPTVVGACRIEKRSSNVDSSGRRVAGATVVQVL